MLKQRLATAIVLIPLALFAIYGLPLKWFSWIVMAVLVMAAWEWSPLMGVTHKGLKFLYCLLVGGVMLALTWFTPVDQAWQLNQLSMTYFAPTLIGGIWWFFSLFLISSYPKSHCIWAKSRLYVAIIGLLILIPAWSAIISLRALYHHSDEYFGANLLLLVLLLVWAADIGAYFIGKRFGKTKLLPQVSPGKTKEGFWGGIFVAVLVLVFFRSLLKIPTVTPLELVFLALFTVTMSVVGDLTESMFKRCAGVKDSGSLLPGHGGLLDRIDSLTAALPAFLLGYLIWVQ